MRDRLTDSTRPLKLMLAVEVAVEAALRLLGSSSLANTPPESAQAALRGLGTVCLV